MELLCNIFRRPLHPERQRGDQRRRGGVMGDILLGCAHVVSLQEHRQVIEGEKLRCLVELNEVVADLLEIVLAQELLALSDCSCQCQTSLPLLTLTS